MGFPLLKLQLPNSAVHSTKMETNSSCQRTLKQLHNSSWNTSLSQSEEEKQSESSQLKLVLSRRSGVLTTMVVLGATAMLEAQRPEAKAESWGTHSFIKEKYFQPSLSPEEAVARIKQTTEGLKDMRHMLDTMSWRYVLFYIRLKSAYLDADLKNAMATLPESRRKSYVKTANEVVDNMSELDRYVRSPKVYESYLYYEKTLKSLDELVAILA